MRIRQWLVWAGAAGLAAMAAVGSHAQKTGDGDWPMYAHDLAGTKFSPLKQITAGNAGQLQPAWNLTLVERPAGAQGRVGERAVRIFSNPEVSPIVVNGVMYLLSAGNTITALDGATGKQIWQHKIDGDSTGRGVAFWPGD